MRRCTSCHCYVRRALSDLRADLLTALPASRAAAVRDAIACATTACSRDGGSVTA